MNEGFKVEIGQDRLIGRYLLADICVEVRSIHDYIHNYCAIKNLSLLQRRGIEIYTWIISTTL